MAARMRTRVVVRVVELLGDEASDADLAEVVEECADLLGGLVDSVGVLVEQSEKQSFAPLAVAGLAGGAGPAGQVLDGAGGLVGFVDAELAEPAVERLELVFAPEDQAVELADHVGGVVQVAVVFRWAEEGQANSVTPAPPWRLTGGPSTPPSPTTAPSSGSRPAGSCRTWSSGAAKPKSCWPTTPQHGKRAAGAGSAATTRGTPAATPTCLRPVARWRRRSPPSATSGSASPPLADHQQNGQPHLADTAVRRSHLDTTVAQIDTAIDRTGPGRVTQLAANPLEHLLVRLGPAHQTPAGRAVWCHHALGIEAARDPNDGRSPTWSGRSFEADRARRQVTVADQLLQTATDRPEPAEWARLAEHAHGILNQLARAERSRPNRQSATGQPQQPQPSSAIDPPAQSAQPSLSL